MRLVFAYVHFSFYFEFFPNVCVHFYLFIFLQPSVLALCLLNLEIETIKSVELLEILLLVKKHLKVSIFRPGFPGVINDLYNTL